MPYLPKHRADRPADSTYSEATCSGVRTDGYGFGGCVGTCPRHEPGDYAEMQARHATDSLPMLR